MVKFKMDLGSSKWKKVIRDGAAQLGMDVSDEQAGFFGVHARELLNWNQRINLTAVTDPLEVAVKHYVDSIAAVPFIKPNASLLDAGSGGGFPGMPLKIMLPQLNVTLLEVRRKRVSFLKHALRTMGIADVSVCGERLETATEYLASEGGFDVVVSRAFSNLKVFAVNALPVLKPGGRLLAYKGIHGETLQSEMAELEKAATDNDNEKRLPKGGRLHVDIQPFVLPWLNVERNLVIITT